MADKVQKIREEVVRLHNLLPVMDGDNISVNYADRICTALKMYIDSLNEEPASDDLYEAATKYAEKKCFLDKAILTDGEMLIAKAKQRFDFYNLATAFEDGANWQKEKMDAL